MDTSYPPRGTVLFSEFSMKIWIDAALNNRFLWAEVSNYYNLQARAE